MKKTILIYQRFVLILILGLIAGLVSAPDAYAYVSCIERHSNHTRDDCKNKPYITKEFILDGPGALEAFTPAGNIEVKSVKNTNKVRIELYVDRGYAFWSNSKNLDNYRITMIQRGNDLVASVERKTKETGFFSDQMSFSFKIYAPPALSAQLKTSGGNVSISGLEGDQLAKTSGGNIELSQINGKIGVYTAGGHIDIRSSKGVIFAQTMGGNIKIDEAKGEIRLKTSGGRITAERLSGSLLAKVGGGDIRAHFVHVAEGISLETSAGNIYLEVPSCSGYDLLMKGSSIEMPDMKYFEGTKGSGLAEGMLNKGGASINLTTASGKITFKTYK